MPGDGMEKPEESKIQEGRGAGVISTITQVTALEAGSKPLKSTAIGLARKCRLDGRTTRGERCGEIRMNPQRGRNP
jgi:hypothetical protein